jgi:hypothetical protein
MKRSPTVLVLACLLAVLLLLPGCAAPLHAADLRQLAKQTLALINQGEFQQAIPLVGQLVEAVRARKGGESFEYAEWRSPRKNF